MSDRGIYCITITQHDNMVQTAVGDKPSSSGNAGLLPDTKSSLNIGQSAASYQESLQPLGRRKLLNTVTDMTDDATLD